MNNEEIIRHRNVRDRFLSTVCHLVRPLPVGRRTILNMARRIMGNPERFVLNTDGFMFVVDCIDTDVAIGVATGIAYEPIVGALFLAQLRPGDVVFDVGANKGYYTLLAAQRVGKSGRVFGYEPDPRNFYDLRCCEALNELPSLKFFDLAISDSEGTAQFDQGTWEEGVSAWGFLSPKGEASTNGKKNCLEVRTTTIDKEVSRLGVNCIDCLKMDIQGGEADAIDGMSETLAKGRIGTFLLELHDMDLSEAQTTKILSRIENAGYTGFYFDQEAFSEKEALAAIAGKKPIDLASRGTPVSRYSWQERRGGKSPGDYVHPYQFVFRKA